LVSDNRSRARLSGTVGSDEALRVIEHDEIGQHVPTITEWLYAHVDNLTGVQSASLVVVVVMLMPVRG
jgi:hypothetical protein